MTTRHHASLGRESFIVGLLGAGTVALWFLVLDMIRGEPLTTPSILGQILLGRRTSPDFTHPIVWAVAAYTVVHVMAFVLFGILITKMVHLAIRDGLVRFALLMVFAAFEVFFIGLMLMFDSSTGSRFPVWTVLTANTLATVVMGTYLWRNHPALKREIQRHPLGV